MKLTTDSRVYDEMQRTLIGALIESVKAELEAEKLDPALTRKLVENISFSLAVILDGSRDASFGNDEVCPVLTFQNEDDDLISSGGNSWMHEYVFGTIKEVFSKSQ